MLQTVRVGDAFTGGDKSIDILDALYGLTRWERMSLASRMEAIVGEKVSRPILAILGYISVGGPARPSTLATALGLQRSTISRHVAAAKKQQLLLVTVDPTDIRASTVSLTPRGSILQQSFARAWYQVVDEIASGWVEADQATLFRLLTVLVERLRLAKGETASSRQHVGKIAYPLSFLVRWVSTKMHDDLVSLAGLEIERSTVAILALLANRGPMRAADLAELLAVDRSTVSPQVASATERGLICGAGDPRDRRSFVLRLTDEGKAIDNVYRGAWNDMTRFVILDWSRQDRVDLVRLLGQLAERLDLGG